MAHRSHEDIHVHPVLADILAGEFVVPFDRDGGVYTLGRFMVDAYMQGEGPVVPEQPEVSTMNPDVSVAAYRHWPALLPGTVVSAYARLEGVDRSGIRLIGVGLESSGTRTLRVIEDHNALAVVSGNETTVNGPLPTGPRLAIERKLATHFAAEFMERAYINLQLRELFTDPDDPAQG